MKLVVLKNNLLEALASVERAVGSNTNLPILKNILIKAGENQITFSATDLEFAVTHAISGKIIESGAIAVPSAIFGNIVKNLTSERVSIEEKGKKVLITTDNYEAVIEAQDPKEFPIIPSIRNTHENLAIGTAYFTESLGNVIIATQYSDIRPEISGVYVEWDGDRLVLVATDSFRLAERALDSSQLKSTMGALSAIIPLKTAEEMLRIFGSRADTEMKLYFDQNQVFAATESVFLTSRLIDGKFPDYRAVLPKEKGHEIELKRQEFMSAIKLTSSFSGRSNDVTVRTGDNKKFLEIYSSSSAVGENCYRIPAKVKGEKLSVVFNWRYLLDGLKVFKGEEIVLGITSPERPASITSVSDHSLLYILMPIKS